MDQMPMITLLFEDDESFVELKLPVMNTYFETGVALDYHPDNYYYAPLVFHLGMVSRVDKTKFSVVQLYKSGVKDFAQEQL